MDVVTWTSQAGQMKLCVCSQILYGNLAPEGCVGKITGKEGLVFEGPARVFDSEEAMLDALSEDPQVMKVRTLCAEQIVTYNLASTLPYACMKSQCLKTPTQQSWSLCSC